MKVYGMKFDIDLFKVCIVIMIICTRILYLELSFIKYHYLLVLNNIYHIKHHNSHTEILRNIINNYYCLN